MTDRFLSAYDWPGQPTLRSNAVVTVDGSVSRNGSSMDISGSADNRLLHHLRATADVVVVGAATAASEDYIGVRLPEEHKETRLRDGQASPPPLAIFTQSGIIVGSQRFLQMTEVPNLIVCTGDDESWARTTEYASASNGALIAIDGRLGVAAAIGDLRSRGFRRILCEGGPRLLDALLAADLVDELCVTLSPHVGGDGRGMQTGLAPTSYAPVFVTIHDGFVFSRWKAKR